VFAGEQAKRRDRGNWAGRAWAWRSSSIWRWPRGGEVQVKNDLKEGSTFSFTLPVETLDPAPQVHPQFTAS